MDGLPKDLLRKIIWLMNPTDSLRIRALNVYFQEVVGEFNLYWFYWFSRVKKPECERYHYKPWTESCIKGISLPILYEHLYRKGIVPNAIYKSDLNIVYKKIEHLQDGFPCYNSKHYFYYPVPCIEMNDVTVKDMNPKLCYLIEYMFMMYRAKRYNLKKLELVDRPKLLMLTKAHIGSLELQIKELKQREELLENYTYYSRTPCIFANKSSKRYK